ncbi:MAG: hypothetical protein D3906_07480 [Candidatus Electrothrix sp. AUS1_2]|nr:hypothetical protein [Candidatus Electrothrix sp. AUS1_2]
MFGFWGRTGRRINDRFRTEVAQALISFIRQDMEDVRKGQRGSSVNCSTEDLLIFAEEVGVSRSNAEFLACCYSERKCCDGC